MAIVPESNENNVKNIQEKDIEVTIIQPFGSGLKIVPKGYRLVTENLFRERISIQQPGLQWASPIRKKKLICVSRLSVEIGFDDTLNNADNLELTVKPVTIQFHIDTRREKSTNETGIEKFYKEKAALERVKEIIKRLIVKIVKFSKYDELKGLRVSKKSLPVHLTEIIKKSVISDIDDICKDYGIVIDNIMFGDINLPKSITDAEAERRSQAIENQKNVAKAEADKIVAQLNAEAQKYLNSVNYDLLYDAAKKMNLTPLQISDILKRMLTTSNATIIEGAGGLDSLVAMAYGSYSRYASAKDAAQQDNAQHAIDVHYDDELTNGRIL